jgi:hypothetical protein
MSRGKKQGPALAEWTYQVGIFRSAARACGRHDLGAARGGAPRRAAAQQRWHRCAGALALYVCTISGTARCSAPAPAARPGHANRTCAPQEEEALLRLVKQHGTNWGAVAKELPGHTAKECGERWAALWQARASGTWFAGRRRPRDACSM